MSETISHEASKNYCAANRRSSGRARLPVAPKAQARVRFSPEKPLPRALSPEQALNWLDYLAKQGEIIKVVNINGPGDPLATPDLTIQTMELLRNKYPELSICLTTLGLGAAKIADKLSDLGLAHVSILMDGVDPEVIERIYAWIRPGARTLPLKEAAQLLIDEQAASITALVERGLPVLVKTTVYPGINSENVTDIAKKAAELGAREMKLFPNLAKEEDCAQPLEEAEPAELEYLATQAAKLLPTQFIDLNVCQDMEELDFDEAPLSTVPKADKNRPYLAVCSSDGFEVDLHLGQVDKFLIYGPKNGPVTLLEVRPAPEPGKGEARWKEIALTLSDCFAVLAAAAGEAPKRALSEKGLAVVTQEGNVEGLVEALYGGGKKKGEKK